MNRRQLLQGVAGLVLAGSAELILPERRMWALDRTMVEPDVGQMVADAYEAELRRLLWESEMRLKRRLENVMLYGTADEGELGRIKAAIERGEYRMVGSGSV